MVARLKVCNYLNNSTLSNVLSLSPTPHFILLDAIVQNTKSKFIRPSDRQKLQEVELEKEQRRIDEERKKRIEKAKSSTTNNKSNDNLSGNKESHSSHLNSSPSLNSPRDSDKNARSNVMIAQITQLSINDIKRKLRSFGHPITLFAESDSDRISRLAALMIKALDDGDKEEDEGEDEYRIRAKKQLTDEQDEAELEAEDLLDDQQLQQQQHLAGEAVHEKDKTAHTVSNLT